MVKASFTKLLPMKKYISLLFILSFMTTIANSQTETNTKQQLRHVVLFSFKSTSSVDDVKKVEDAFRALPSKIKEVKGFEWGKNNSPEGLDQGFTHCFIVSFNAEKDREVYLPHPAHKAFVDVLKPHLDKVLVIDYWAGK
jgi:hypothetical protein